MSLTSWKTWASGDVLTAADMNTFNRDNGRWLSHNATGGAPMCRVRRSASQTGLSTGDKITYDTETFDPNNMHDNASNTSRITVPSSSGGKYISGSNVHLQSVSSAINAESHVEMLLNNATAIGLKGVVQDTAATRQWFLNIVTLYALAATDYLETRITFNNMTSVDATANSDYSPAMWAIWIGE